MVISDKILGGLIKKQERLIVGVSGGADSMCLLSLIDSFSKRIDISFLVVHINHNIRGEKADRDEAFVKKYCEKNNIDFKSIHVKALEYAKDESKTIEQAARELRYNSLFMAFEEYNADKLFVAHHQGDQAETVFMHIARGSSLKGASGMKFNNNKIIRPLLNFSKEEILEYNKVHKIDYIEDETNSDINYTRNFIRNEVFPKLKKVYPNVERALCSFAKTCLRDEEFIESMLPLQLLKSEKCCVKINEQVVNLHKALSTRLIKKAFELIGIYSDIEECHIEQILELFNLKNGAMISLPNKLFAHKEYENVVISYKNQLKDLKQIDFDKGEVNLDGYGRIKVEFLQDLDLITFGDGNHYIDLDKVSVGAIWRTRKDGDIFSKLGSGSKKLVDYYTDKKIPKRLRDFLPVLAVDNKIIAVAGYDISESVKIDSDTERIAKISYINEQKW